VALLSATSAQAQDDDAVKILKAMSDYVSGQKAISLSYNADIEVITPEIQKIQFTGSGKLQMSRPDKLRVSRTGGYTDVQLIVDGTTVTVFNKDGNSYAQIESPGSIDQLVDLLRNEYGLELPGADLLVTDPYGVLMPEVLDAKHIGRGVINGVECDHLAFRNRETDWQIWVEIGDRPIPCKYVITSKATAAAPQYTLLITDWKSEPEIAADAFAFQAPEGAKKVDLKTLKDIDEVPPGLIEGETR
jgi:hypothetical protein